ncbi:hypothetical protein HPP92_025273 [Vanilla planifolia]|uniref:Uncharacterized protein n=1 Tax=Vanilla planifolia TaxID=51239 RepID=A0A835PIU9_VANPL|nr:hypothetical protein HPP92_025273 [Vanilla planifolia]
MADWGPVFVAASLFVLLTPGLVFQIPGKGRLAEVGNMQTGAVSVFVHSPHLLCPHHHLAPPSASIFKG